MSVKINELQISKLKLFELVSYIRQEKFVASLMLIPTKQQHYCYYSLRLHLYLKQSSVFKSRASQEQWKQKKTLKYKITVCYFSSIIDGSYISTNIIDKNMKPFLYLYIIS